MTKAKVSVTIDQGVLAAADADAHAAGLNRSEMMNAPYTMSISESRFKLHHTHCPDARYRRLRSEGLSG